MDTNINIIIIIKLLFLWLGEMKIVWGYAYGISTCQYLYKTGWDLYWFPLNPIEIRMQLRTIIYCSILCSSERVQQHQIVHFSSSLSFHFVSVLAENSRRHRGRFTSPPQTLPPLFLHSPVNICDCSWLMLHLMNSGHWHAFISH